MVTRSFVRALGARASFALALAAIAVAGATGCEIIIGDEHRIVGPADGSVDAGSADAEEVSEDASSPDVRIDTGCASGTCLSRARTCAVRCSQQSQICRSACEGGERERNDEKCREKCQRNEAACKDACRSDCLACNDSIACGDDVACADAIAQ